MAQKVQIILEDDIDGSKADETVRFALDGTNYEIDLSSQHAEKLRSSLAEFVAAGRKTTAKGTSAPAPKASTGGRKDSAKIREWAAEHGYSVNARGRIQGDVVEAYRKAHS